LPKPAVEKPSGWVLRHRDANAPRQ
jgi:hypothetical protein